MYHRFLELLRSLMLPCPSRQWLHLDCPGCGMQRSLLALMEGDLQGSFRYHPAALPLLALLLVLPLHLKQKIRYGRPVLIGLQLAVAVISAGFYVYKIAHHQIMH